MIRYVEWFYGVLIKLGVTDHHDKYLHAVLIAAWAILISTVLTPGWAVVTSIIIMVGRELYNVYQAWREGYTPRESLSKFSGKDILAGVFGLIVGLVIYLVLYRICTILML